MKILVLTGSGHKKGTSAALADKFIEGALEAGNEVYRFDSAFKNVHPCLACERCNTLGQGCVFKDDMEEVNPYLLNADMVVFVSPVYYYGMSAALKLVIDRFYGNDSKLHKNKKSVLIMTMEEIPVNAADGCVETFRKMTGFLEWEEAGILIANDCVNVDKLNATDFPEKAYELGKSFKG